MAGRKSAEATSRVSDAARGCTATGPESRMPEPGSPAFARLARSLDKRSWGYRAVKRAADVVISAAAVAIGIVPGAILSVVIALDTKGTPIYAQTRVGKDGRPFKIYKFRSMVADADDVERHFTAEQLEKWRRERKVEDDPRITPVGRFIRKHSIDEVPQFLNVLLGQMSVVGPRAITYDELEHFGDQAPLLLSVAPGITGLWQSGPRNDATFETGHRQDIELEYAGRPSLVQDAMILFRTFSVVLGNGTGQ